MVKDWGVIFDLDDTLYNENDYVLSGFRHVAKELALRSGVSATMLYEQMVCMAANGNRSRVFDELLQDRPLLAQTATALELVSIYREHMPDIRLSDSVHCSLDRLCSRCFLGLLSDGHLIGQRKKVVALGLADVMDQIVLTDIWGREYWKPHPRGYTCLQLASACPSRRMIYIGDNPAKDFSAPNLLGWTTIRLRLPMQLHRDKDAKEVADSPQITCFSWGELDNALWRIMVD